MASLSKRLKTTLSSDAVKRICLLKALEADFQDIPLNEGQNIVGRRVECGIRDSKCSKNQLELNVDLDRPEIKLKVLGINPSGVNGFMIMQNDECGLKHKDLVEIVYGRLHYEVTFKPPPPEEEKTEVPKQESKSSTEDAWDSIENGKVLVYTSAGVRSTHQVAAYDMDGTLIKTKSGNVFPKTIDDWEIIYPEVPRRLKVLHENGFKICIFTNQGGIAKGKVDVNEFKGKIKKIVKRLGVPVQVFIAAGDGYYRKPLPGMWEYMEQKKNDGIKLQLDKCFFVGDAAGRMEISSGVNKRKKDHSSADRYFAANVGTMFYTPEEHFLNRRPEDYAKPEFEPREALEAQSANLLEPPTIKLKSDKTEMILMVGMPGTGKSHFCHQHLAPLGYTIINADTLGSTNACLKACEKALASGESCVIDNTNVDVESRKKFVALAVKLNVPCRCFTMNVSLAQMRHNIAFRQLTDTKHSKINEMVINMMKKKFKEPSLAEGFLEVAKVNLRPNFQGDKKMERLYKLYLVEK